MSAIRLAGVSMAFADVRAVVDCSLEVRNGEFLALLGPSGSGKTTLLRILGGFLKPDRGSLWIGDRDVGGLPPFRRNIGFMFQSYALFPHLTVRENVAFGLHMRRKFRSASTELERVQSYLALVDLPGYGDRYPHQLSGGQQQRVALARALVIEPDVLLLDEPLCSLDKKLREEMQVELKALQRKLGITTVLVTHDQEEALALAERIAVMSRGRIEQIGTPTEVYEYPSTRFVSQFIGASNFFEGRGRVNGRDAVFRTTSGIDLDVTAYHGVTLAEVVSVMVRPEKIEMHLQRPTTNHRNVFTSVVKHMVYQGNFTRVIASIGTAKVTVVTQNFTRAAGSKPIEPGQEVYFSIRPESFRLFTAEDMKAIAPDVQAHIQGYR